MAFYRCDRGLGFDTSNSTGTSNDVLKYSRNTIENIKIIYPTSITTYYSRTDYNRWGGILNIWVDYNTEFIYNRKTSNFIIDKNWYLYNDIRLSSEDLIPENIKKDINIYNISGSRNLLKFPDKSEISRYRKLVRCLSKEERYDEYHNNVYFTDLSFVYNDYVYMIKLPNSKGPLKFWVYKASNFSPILCTNINNYDYMLSSFQPIYDTLCDIKTNTDCRFLTCNPGDYDTPNSFPIDKIKSYLESNYPNIDIDNYEYVMSSLTSNNRWGYYSTDMSKFDSCEIYNMYYKDNKLYIIATISLFKPLIYYIKYGTQDQSAHYLIKCSSIRYNNSNYPGVQKSMVLFSIDDNSAINFEKILNIEKEYLIFYIKDEDIFLLSSNKKSISKFNISKNEIIITVNLNNAVNTASNSDNYLFILVGGCYNYAPFVYKYDYNLNLISSSNHQQIKINETTNHFEKFTYLNNAKRIFIQAISDTDYYLCVGTDISSLYTKTELNPIGSNIDIGYNYYGSNTIYLDYIIDNNSKIYGQYRGNNYESLGIFYFSNMKLESLEYGKLTIANKVNYFYNLYQDFILLYNHGINNFEEYSYNLIFSFDIHYVYGNYLYTLRFGTSNIITDRDYNNNGEFYKIPIYNNTFYLLNDYDTNYNGYNIDSSNSNYTDYYFN